MRTIEQIIHAVTEAHQIATDRLMSRERSETVALCRLHLAYELRNRAKYGYREIGEIIRRKHSTAVHDVKTFGEAMTMNKDIRAKYEQVNTMLQ